MKKQHFKALQAEWYSKLKESGFDDIEDTNSPREMLKSWSITSLMHNSYEKADALGDYFNRARNFLNEHDFDSLLDKEVWEMHSEGMSLREIAQRHRDNGVEIYKDGVHKIIKKYERIMFGNQEKRTPPSKPVVCKRRPATG